MNIFTKNLFILLVAVGFTASVVNAADFYFATDPSITDTTDGGNWYEQSGNQSGNTPGASDIVLMPAGKTIDITTAESYQHYRMGMMYNGSSAANPHGPEPTGQTNVTIKDSGSLTTSNNVFVGMTWNRDAGAADAKLTVESGGSLNVSNQLLLGNVYNQSNSTASTGELVVNGGAVAVSNLLIGHKNNQNSSGLSTGTLTVNSGTVTGTNAIVIAHADDSNGTFTINGGSTLSKGLTFGSKDTTSHSYTNQVVNFNLLGGEVEITADGWVNWQDEATTERNFVIGAGVLTAINQVSSTSTTGYNAKLGTIRNLLDYMILNTNGNQSISVASTATSATDHAALLAQYDTGSNGQGGGTEQYAVDGGTLWLGYDDNTSATGATALWAVAVPEPSSYALIAGCLAMSAIMLRRRL